MSSVVFGPADVAVGDLVSFHGYNSFRSPAPVGPCVVVRVGKASLTVRGPDGREFRKAYVVTYRSRSWRGGETHTHYSFHRLDATDRWLTERPATSLSITADHRGFCSVVLTSSDLRNMEATTADLAALSIWIGRQPTAGAR